MKAICMIEGDVNGIIYFSQQYSHYPVKISGYIKGLSKGLHGIHIHEFGDLSNGCTSAGEHFNPHNSPHGAKQDDYKHRHLGDLGNIDSTNDIITSVDLSDNLISLFGPYNILGRSLVVHEHPDDLGRTNHPLSKTSGNSGGRLGCGIIGVTK
jgi:superoxide dismutase, Cu-Zn family